MTARRRRFQSEFVDDHVVYNEHRRLDETPIEIDTVVHRAGAPAVTIINDLGRCELYTKLTCVLLHAGENLFFGSRNIPISQHFTTLGLMRGGHQKEAGELDLTARGLGDFNSVVPLRLTPFRRRVVRVENGEDAGT